MRICITIFLTSFFSQLAHAGVPPAPVVFQGVMGSADASQVRLWFAVDGHGSGWIKPGQVFGDYVLVRYDAKKFVATVQKGEAAPIDVELQTTRVKSGAESILAREQAAKALMGWWTVREISTGTVFHPPLETVLENSDLAAVYAQLQQYGLGITPDDKGGMTIATDGISVTMSPLRPGKRTSGGSISMNAGSGTTILSGDTLRVDAQSDEGGTLSIMDTPWQRSNLPNEIAANLDDADIAGLRQVTVRSGGNEYTFNVPKTSPAAPLSP